MLRSDSTPRSGLPGSVLAAAYVLAACLPLVVATLWGSAGANIWHALGTACGLAVIAIMALQFLSSGRFESLSGRLGIDRTMGFHRISAMVVLAIAVLHPLAYAAPTFLSDLGAGFERLGRMLSAAPLRSGAVALGALFFLVGFALVRSRPFVRYEVWRASHGTLAFVALLLALHHAMTLGDTAQHTPMRVLLIALGLIAALSLLITMLVRPLRSARTPWAIEAVKPMGANITEITLRETKPEAFSFRAGQFVWLWPTPGAAWFRDHPLSIASAPAQLPRLRLLVREAGDGTRQLCTTEPGTIVTLDGPHGSFGLCSDVKGPVLLIAGGVGIAPLLGILEQAAARRDPRSFRLLYCARSSDAFVARPRLREIAKMLDLSVQFAPESDAGNSGGATGRLDAGRVMGMTSGLRLADAAALLCGPPPMMEIAADALLDAGMRPDQIYYERFDYGAGRGRLDAQRRRLALAVLAVPLLMILVFAMR